MDNGIIQTAQNSMTEAQEKRKTMNGLIEKMSGEIKKALPSVITPERFTRMILSAISVTPKLAECTPKSFLAAMMTAAQLGVEPNTALGQAYLIPYNNKGVLTCQFQLGYKGLIDLAYRSGQVSMIGAYDVRENDEFHYELGLNPFIRHIPARENRGAPIYYYAMFKTKDGGIGFSVMSMQEIRMHAQKYSKAFESSSSPWKTNFDEMAKKTVLKRCLKYAPMKTEFVRAMVQDETIKTNIMEDMVDVPDETVIEVDKDTGEVVNPNQEENSNAVVQ